MAVRSFLNDILRHVAWSEKSNRPELKEADLVALCEQMLGDQGEASGLINALQVLDGFEALEPAGKHLFFKAIAEKFGVDEAALNAKIERWKNGDKTAARDIHFAAEPLSQNLIRTLNMVPGATARLVSMRADMLAIKDRSPEIKGLDRDFQHLFSSWFNRGFLEIRRIDWSTSAEILEKIISYEAVHEITGWDDLRQRVGDPDRRLFAFFHPAMPSDPLIFVEVALTRDIPSAIAPILSRERVPLDPDEAKTAVFYSISNCQQGLHGISFGNFLIKQVVTELLREMPDLEKFVTLSPVPALRKWIAQSVENDDPLLSHDDRDALANLDDDTQINGQLAQHLAALYLTQAKRTKGHSIGAAFDPVAHFHLRNGAVLHDIHATADTSVQGQKNSWGVMVNYLYDGKKIEAHHQAYATKRQIVTSAKVRNLAKI